MKTRKEFDDEFTAIKDTFEFAKSKEGKSLVLYNDYLTLLNNLIERLSERREFINLSNKVKTFTKALLIEKDKYYGNGGGKKKVVKKRKTTKK